MVNNGKTRFTAKSFGSTKSVKKNMEVTMKRGPKTQQSDGSTKIPHRDGISHPIPKGASNEIKTLQINALSRNVRIYRITVGGRSKLRKTGPQCLLHRLWQGFNETLHRRHLDTPRVSDTL